MTNTSPNSQYIANLRRAMSRIFSHIRTKNYVRSGCDYNPREMSYDTGTWWVMWKTGIPVGFMGWSRVTSDRTKRVSSAEGQPDSLSRTTATKKDKRSANGDNSCGIANEPSGHPNDGWLEGPEPELFDTSRENSTFWRDPSLHFPSPKGYLKYFETFRFRRVEETKIKETFLKKLI